MYGDGDDGQVEVVEHDGDVVVEASPRVEVEAEGPTADQRDGRYLCQPEGRKKRGRRYVNMLFFPTLVLIPGSKNYR